MTIEPRGIKTDQTIDRHLAITNLKDGIQPTEVLTPNSITLRLVMSPPTNPQIATIARTYVVANATFRMVHGSEMKTEPIKLLKSGSGK
jgi:hypothetical protein